MLRRVKLFVKKRSDACGKTIRSIRPSCMRFSAVLRLFSPLGGPIFRQGDKVFKVSKYLHSVRWPLFLAPFRILCPTLSAHLLIETGGPRLDPPLYPPRSEERR